MKRRDVFRAFCGVLLTGTAWLANSSNANAGAKPGDKFAHCAKACRDCAKACQVCSQHCSGMIAAGMKEHIKSKRLSDDNAEICAAAAKITARRGPTVAIICEACAKACDACEAECRKYPTMKQMKDCAEACRACAKACRDMLKAA